MKSKGLLGNKTFFLVKYSVMVSIESAIFFLVIIFLGKINLLQTFLLSLLNLTGISLLIARHFEKYIDRISLAVYKKVSISARLKRILMKYVMVMRRNVLCDRTFFIVRYWIIVNMQNAILLSIISLTGPVNFLQSIPITVTVVLTSFLVAKYFERDIDRLAHMVCASVNRSVKLRKFVSRHL
jgi:hypothetical protein